MAGNARIPFESYARSGSNVMCKVQLSNVSPRIHELEDSPKNGKQPTVTQEGSWVRLQGHVHMGNCHESIWQGSIK